MSRAREQQREYFYDLYMKTKDELDLLEGREKRLQKIESLKKDVERLQQKWLDSI